jgi:cytochrome P450
MSERVEKSNSEKASGLTERKDIFYWLTNSNGPDGNPGYSMPELYLEARTLVTAGSDTSAITLAAAFFYLCRNLNVLAKLQKELRSTFATFDEIRAGPKMNSCTYLRAVIDETLRITPPVPSSIPREVQAGGITINNQYFPKGVILGTSAYCLHHNVENFPDASTYRPERWIVTEEAGVTAEDVAAARMAFVPFSLGSRGCVGKPMAYAEISMALASVFWRFDVRLKRSDTTGEGNNGEFMLADVFVGERDGPWVEFRRVR